MPYDNLVTDFPASELKPGDTFVSPDWVYAFVVFDPAQVGFTPQPGMKYAQSLVEGVAQAFPEGMTVKKVKMYHYSFED